MLCILNAEQVILDVLVEHGQYSKTSKHGKPFVCKSKRTVYVVQCDVCGRVLRRSKGEAYKLLERERHCCSPECIGKLTMGDRYRDHVPRAARRKSGYVYVGQRREHQIVMENHLGRPLQKGELIHHVDGDKGNNTLDNLVLCADAREHNRIHGQLEGLAFLLFQRGDIAFCHNCKMYYTNDIRCICSTENEQS